MSFTIRPAVRQNTSIILGLAGPSGGGKTFSAFSIAKGLSGGERFAVIDTEAGRALHYADQFDFDHIDFEPPFSPERYTEAINTAAGYQVIVIDSASHEWAGDGGVLDMQDAEHSKSNYADHKKMQSWIKPKMAHKRMMSRLLQQRAHLIFCLRAEEKTLVRRAEKQGRKVMEVVSPADRPVHERWAPICEKNFMYEMTASVLVLPDRPGVAVPVKVQEQHRAMIDTGAVLTEEAGAQLAAWAAGGAKRELDEDFLEVAEEWATRGPDAFKAWWAELGADDRRKLPKAEVDRLIDVAKRAAEAA